MHFKTEMSEKGIIHISLMKIRASHIRFLRKSGLTVYLAALKRGGGYSARTAVLCLL